MNEKEILKILFNTYFERVYRATYLIVQNDFIARDAVQEAFIAAYKQLDQLKDLDNMYAWLAAAASNQAINMLKKHRNCIPVASFDEVEKELPHHPNSLEQKDREIDLMQALKMLNDKHREVIVFKYYIGLTEKEIGEILNLPLGTVKSRLSRSRILLKNILAADAESGVVL